MYFRTFLQGKSFQGAVKVCSDYYSELMPINKIRYFVRDEIKSTDIYGSNFGVFRVNAIHETNGNADGAKTGGIFSNKDIRFQGFAYVRKDDPNDGVVLDTVWEKYFDSREKYDQLIAIKRKFDPDYIFTANSFGVDASNAPEEKYIKITAKN